MHPWDVFPYFAESAAAYPKKEHRERMVWHTVQDMEDVKGTMVDCQATDLTIDLYAPTVVKSHKLKIKAGKPQCFSRGRPGFRGTLWVASRVPSALSTSNS